MNNKKLIDARARWQELKRTSEFQLTSRFVLILILILIMVNLAFVAIAAYSIYDYVDDQAESTAEQIMKNYEEDKDWSAVLAGYDSKHNDIGIMVKESDGETHYARRSQRVFHNLREADSSGWLRNFYFTEHGIYYLYREKTARYQIYLALTADSLVRMISMILLFSILLNLLAIVIGAFFIRSSIRRWNGVLTTMDNEIQQYEQNPGEQKLLTVPQEPIEIRNVADSFNHLLADQERALTREKQFVTDASHELRTPIAAIRGHVQLIRRRGETNPEVIPRSLAFIEQESKRMEILVNQLLQLGQAEKDSKKEVIDLSELALQEVQRIKALHPQSIISAIASGIIFDGNGLEMQQVLQNLLENAVKYSEDTDEIKVTLAEYRGEIRFQVADTGRGIATENKQKIFERFFREDSSHSSQIKGSGIGLAIVKTLVEKEHGTITVTDNQPRGTIFTVVWPRK